MFYLLWRVTTSALTTSRKASSAHVLVCSAYFFPCKGDPLIASVPQSSCFIWSWSVSYKLFWPNLSRQWPNGWQQAGGLSFVLLWRWFGILACDSGRCGRRECGVGHFLVCIFVSWFVSLRVCDGATPSSTHLPVCIQKGGVLAWVFQLWFGRVFCQFGVHLYGLTTVCPYWRPVLCTRVAKFYGCRSQNLGINSPVGVGQFAQQIIPGGNNFSPLQLISSL